MMELKTEYLGLQLPNPLIASSSSLTSTLDQLIKLEKSGIGAVVLKSIFEEQIGTEAATLGRYSDYPEAADYLRNYLRDDYLQGHLNLIAEAKMKLKIPVIASINCMGIGEWVDYARRIEEVGADALELNIFLLPTDMTQRSDEIEEAYLQVISKVADSIKIPVSVKVGARFTNVLGIARQVYYRHGKGIVLFNRFFEPDVDVENIQLVQSDPVSHRSELRNSLRTVALCASQLPKLDIAVSTGVHTGEDVVKALLVGARGVQICSTIFENGLGVIGEMTDYLTRWMDKHSFRSVDEFCGMLRYKQAEDTDLYQRVQYMRFFPGNTP